MTVTPLLLGAIVAGLGGASAGGTSTTAAPLGELRRIVERPDEIVAQLDNGLTAIVKRHGAADVVAVRVYIKTGSIYEQQHLGCGMSHLFEHLLFGGSTTTRSEEQARQMLERLGSRANAYTTKDHTCYWIETASRFLPEAVSLLADFIIHPAFAQSEFDREWGVVQRELEMHHNDPDRQLYYLTYQNVYQVHPARFPVIGYKRAVQSLRRQDIIDYYHRMYVPDNVVVAVVGNVPPGRALAAIKQSFAGFARRPVPNVVLPAEPPQATPRKTVKYMAVPDCRVSIAWPTIRLTDPDLYALDVLSDVLSRGRLSRLVRRIVIEQRLATTISSYSYTPHWAKGIFNIQFTCWPDKLEAVFEAINAELARLKAEPVGDDELQRVKRLTIANHVFSREKAGSIAADLATSYIATGDPHFGDAYVANIQRVTGEQVRRMARKYLVDHRRNVTMILPESMRRAATQPGAAAAGGKARLRRLDNGLRVLIRANPTVGLAVVQIYFNGGLLYESAENNGISHLMARASRYGTRTSSFGQIAELTESRGIRLQAGSGRNTFFYTCKCLADDLPDALAVLADVVQNPSFPPEHVEMLKQRIIARIRRIEDNWQSDVAEFFRKVFFVHSPYRLRTIGSVEAVEALTAEDLRAFHGLRARGPEAVLAIYGDIEPEQAEALAARYFGALPGQPGPPRPVVPPEPTIEGPVAYVKKSKHLETAGIMIGYRGMRLSDIDDLYPMMVLDTITSGYEYPGGWLHEALRGTDPQTGESRDLVYAVHLVNRAWVLPGYIAVVAGCRPERVNQVVQIILEKMQQARDGRFSRQEFERAKELIIVCDALSRQSNEEQAAQACLDELYGLGYDFHDRHVERIQQVSLEQVRRVADKYLRNPVVCISTARPELVELPMEVRQYPGS
ncbi:MAG: M16 family metallopeptidase, partial [Phycisphaerae bacterium]